MVDDDETGFLVDSCDEAAFADRISKLLVDQELSLRLGGRANEVAVARFTAAAVAEKTVTAYRNCLGLEGETHG